MLIEIHMIQNHSPANLNRDDLGAPKTCYFGGVLRSRISSQCLKRSIRMSPEFASLLGAIRTRRLAQLIAMDEEEREKLYAGSARSFSFDLKRFERASEILAACGIAPKGKKGKKSKEEEVAAAEDRSAGLVFVTREAVYQMSGLVKNSSGKADKDLARRFAELIAAGSNSPDMALCGRMLEAKKGTSENGGKDGGAWKNLDTTVEAALQVAHAISTHEARPEVDYYVAKDDIPGEDGGAGFVDEAMFSSACFYKYFSIEFGTLVRNLKGKDELAAHTVGAFIRGAALVNPTGKQNSYAAHNPPDGILVEIRNSPLSYANAFARPVAIGASIKEDGRDMVSQSVAQLGQYVHDIDAGYGRPTKRFWFSPNLRYSLSVMDGKKEMLLADENIRSLDGLIPGVINEIGYDWEEVQKITLPVGVA